MTTRMPAIPTSFGIRLLVLTCAAVALIAAVLALHGSGAVSAQEADCEVTDLGTLSADGVLEASGRWTTEDCDSRFRAGSDAHTYQLQIAQAGRIRIDLTSAEADSYLYLLDEDGNRITDNDDGGARLDARVERDLTPGVYLVEATTFGGRGFGAADFTLSVSPVAGCDPVHLGDLESGADLTATGSWTLNTCGSRFVVEHPAHGYSFNMPEAGRVLIDLISEDGDPVLSLVSPTQGVIAANDDGGGRRNSRIERFLSAGTYIIEATTYLERDLQPLMADFTLVVHLVDEEAEQGKFQLKVETSHTPNEVVAGEPFPVHYRIGNLGGGDLTSADGTVIAYVVGPRVFERKNGLITSAGDWEAGASYHSGEETASATSTASDDVTPFEISFWSPGPSWVFTAIVAFDDDDEEIAFHGLWRNLMVLSGWTFDPVTVKVDDADYTVSAEADDEGEVTVSVSSVADPDADVDAAVRAKAIYAAGVRTQVLDGIFEREAIADLPTTAEAEAFDVASPSSSTLLKAFASEYADGASGLAESLAAGDVLSPVAVEAMILGVAETAEARYASIAASWTALQGKIDGGGTLSFTEAFALQSELAYAERIVAPAVTAGDIVEAARAAAMGWEDSEVQAMVSDLDASCDGAGTLRGALGLAGVEHADTLLALDAELRAVPFYGPLNDGALCAVRGVDAANSRFLRLLSLSRSAELHALLAREPLPAPPAPPAPPLRLRIIAQRTVDARIEVGVELAGGERVLPSLRFVPADAAVDTWLVTGDVRVDGSSIGQIRTRRVADGRIELGFLTADGEEVAPDIRYVPLGPDLPALVWLRSGEFEVPRPAPPE